MWDSRLQFLAQPSCLTHTHADTHTHTHTHSPTRAATVSFEPVNPLHCLLLAKKKKKNSTYCIVLQKTPLFSGSWPCLGTFQYPSEGCALWSIHREKLLLQWEGEGGIEQGEREARGCRDVIFRNVIDIRLILYVLSLWSRRYFRPRSNKKERKKKKKSRVFMRPGCVCTLSLLASPSICSLHVS